MLSFFQSSGIWPVLINCFTSVYTTENTTNMPSKGKSQFKPMKDIKISEKGVEKALNRLNPSKEFVSN
jgi:hypothetical protein